MPFADMMSQHDATYLLSSRDKEDNLALLIYIQTPLIFTIIKSKFHTFIFLTGKRQHWKFVDICTYVQTKDIQIVTWVALRNLPVLLRSYLYNLCLYLCLLPPISSDHLAVFRNLPVLLRLYLYNLRLYYISAFCLPPHHHFTSSNSI